MRLTCLSAIAAVALAIPAVAADNVFEANYRAARDNAGTAAGAAYDAALGTAMQASTTLEPAMQACLDAHRDDQASLHGYFQFAAGGAYQVVLRPKGAFADCIEAAFEGQAVPRPPTLPWYNVFTFTVGDGG